MRKLSPQLSPRLVDMKASGSVHQRAGVIGRYGLELQLLAPPYLKSCGRFIGHGNDLVVEAALQEFLERIEVVFAASTVLVRSFA